MNSWVAFIAYAKENPDKISKNIKERSKIYRNYKDTCKCGTTKSKLCDIIGIKKVVPLNTGIDTVTTPDDELNYCSKKVKELYEYIHKLESKVSTPTSVNSINYIPPFPVKSSVKSSIKDSPTSVNSISYIAPFPVKSSVKPLVKDSATSLNSINYIPPFPVKSDSPKFTDISTLEKKNSLTVPIKKGKKYLQKKNSQKISPNDVQIKFNTR